MGPRQKALALILSAAVSAACDDGGSKPEVDRSQIQLALDKLAVKTGPVGVERWRSEASYVLIEARNPTEHDLDVTLAGELRDSGANSWPLRRESLRVPSGGSRLFALVDAGQAARPQATGARIEVVGAVTVGYPPPFVVMDGNVVMDQDRAVAAGHVVNTAERDGSVIVIGAFFDEAGVALKRTSTLFRLSAGGKRGVQLVGPPGSRSAYLFVGEFNY
ncbi:MAG TPA: hypothetical protein VNO33_02160 [Kofleriaceae bacterium]|nr:hypothetical protein [Kofleriaceae bacterium]